MASIVKSLLAETENVAEPVSIEMPALDESKVASTPLNVIELRTFESLAA